MSFKIAGPRAGFSDISLRPAQSFGLPRRGLLVQNRNASRTVLLANRADRRRSSGLCLAFSDGEALSEAKAAGRNPFQGHARQPDGLQSFLSNTPKGVLLAAAVVGVGGSGLLGYLAGSQAPAAQRLLARVLGAVVASGLAVFGVKKLKEKREGAAVLELYAALARHQNIGDLTADELKAIDAKFGISLSSSRVPEMKAVYDTYIESVIPVTEPLSGDEHVKISAFKDALGLSPHDAAAAHTDVGRRYLRLANEGDKRSGKSTEYRSALNKLIYVSSLVFGERQEAFLLPWKRVVNYGDADLIVAKRNQAKALFQSYLENQANGLPAEAGFWGGVKEFQQKMKLDESIAEEIIREQTRSQVEDHLEKAIECQKRRGRVRDYSDLVREVEYVLDYTQDLQELSEDAEMPKGLGKVTVHGGRLEQGNKSRELRDVFRTYFEEQLRATKQVSDDLLDDMSDLEVILGMGQKEAADIIAECTSKAYRNLLREEVSSGRLDAAESKAGVLGSLCEKLNYDPDAAAALHRQLYRQKLDSLLEKKKLTDEDAKELDRLRNLLCIKKADIDQIHRDTCGRIYTSAVEDALNAGHEKFTYRDQEDVKKAREAVRLDPHLAKDILADTVRRGFMGFVTRSRNKANKLEAAKELKALVYFSNMVVTPLLEDINAVLKKDAEDSKEAATKEIAELMMKAKEMSDKEEAEEAKLAGSTSDEKASPVEAASSSASAAQPALDVQKAEGADMSADGSSSPSTSDPEEEAVPATLKKSQDGLKQEAEASTSGREMRGQKEINLRDDLELRDRTDIYKQFLHYCMSGNIVALPMGTSVQIERDQSEFARLAQLGDVLGLSPLDINAVHTGLAEQAFSAQVQQAMRSGGLTKEKVEELNNMRTQFGLSEASAQKIIKGAQNKLLIDNMNATKATGQMSLQRLLDMQEQGINVSEVTSDELRASLYSKELADALTNGSGEFDRERWVEELPKQLGIKDRRVRQALDTLAKERKRTTLVQSVSYLRQKKLDDAVKSLNNLLACHKALPSDAKETWQPREELMDLFSIYLSRVSDSSKQSELANILDISEQQADSLRNLVDAGDFKLQDAEDEDIF